MRCAANIRNAVCVNIPGERMLDSTARHGMSSPSMLQNAARTLKGRSRGREKKEEETEKRKATGGGKKKRIETGIGQAHAQVVVPHLMSCRYLQQVKVETGPARYRRPSTLLGPLRNLNETKTMR